MGFSQSINRYNITNLRCVGAHIKHSHCIQLRNCICLNGGIDVVVFVSMCNVFTRFIQLKYVVCKQVAHGSTSGSFDIDKDKTK